MFWVLRSTTTDFTVVEPTSKPTIKSLGLGIFTLPHANPLIAQCGLLAATKRRFLAPLRNAPNDMSSGVQQGLALLRHPLESSRATPLPVFTAEGRSS